MIGLKQHLWIPTVTAWTIISLSAAPAPAATQDYSTSTEIAYKIESHDDYYRLKSEFHLQYEYRSDLSTYESTHVIYEPCYGKIKGLKAKFNGHKIGKSHITKFKLSGGDVFFPDDAYYGIDIDSPIRPEDVFTCEYRMEYSQVEYMPAIVIPNGGYIKEYRVTFEHPEEISVSFEFFMPHGDIPYEISHEDGEHTTLTFTDLPEIAAKKFFAYNDLQAAVLVTLTADGRRITPTTPESFVAWYGSMTPLTPVLDSTHENVLSAELQSASTDRERLAVIDDYVRGAVRYIADAYEGHSIIPHDPSLVWDRKYGDCKDRAALVSAIARQHGIPVYMALVGVEPAPEFAGVHTILFDHVICYYRDGDEDFFFDPTERYRSMGGLREEIIRGRALVLDPEHPRFVTITAPFDQPSIEVHITGRCDSLDQASASVTFRYDYLGMVRQMLEKYTGARLDNMLSGLMSLMLYKIGMENYRSASEDDESLTVAADADLSKFIITSSDRWYIPQMSFMLAGSDLFSRQDDTLPIYPRDRTWLRLLIDLESAGMTAAPDSVVSGNDSIASYRATIGTNGDHISLAYEYIRPTKNLAGAVRREFLALMQWYKSRKNEMFILSREK